MFAPIERLRRIWTPGREVEEVMHSLEPQTELDSQIRDLLHRVIQQRGPVTLLLADNQGNTVLNTGTLRWEVVHHEPRPGFVGHREVSVWVED